MCQIITRFIINVKRDYGPSIIISLTHNPCIIWLTKWFFVKLLNFIEGYVMKKTVIYVLISVLWVSPCLADVAIYTWTDKNGIKRYSDRPPEDVKHYETIVVPPEDSESAEPSIENRPEYDQMIDAIRLEKRKTDQERIKSEADRVAKGKLDEETRKKERVEAELKQLQQKIDEAKKRPVGRGYGQSQKNARIGEIEKQIDKLKNSPAEYFQGK